MGGTFKGCMQRFFPPQLRKVLTIFTVTLHLRAFQIHNTQRLPTQQHGTCMCATSAT